MNAHAIVAHATLDSDGLLLIAEFPLGELNARAGGGIGRPLALAPLATVARLARRLGIIVSRGVVVADEEADLELWVRAQPDESGMAGGIRLAISGWRERPAWAPADPAGEHRYLSHEHGDWAWETDAALRLTRVSIEAGRRHGFDAIGLLGQPITSLFALETSDGAVPLVEALARREPLTSQPAAIRGDGTPVLLSADVRRDAAGRFGGFVGSVREEPAATHGPPPLAAAFTAGLDKALRRPLAQIIANADSINAATDGPVPPDYADYAADIANAGRHLLALVDDLVDLQAIERPDFSLAAEPIDLADVARRAAGLLAVRAIDKDVVIDRPPTGTRLVALGDFRRSLQILVNLIGNAVRYAPHGSIVTVSAAGEADTASITVADQGKGIAPQDQARVFAKFERVDPTEAGGNGLGLYIARRLARAMGGDITLASTPGEGASFTFTLATDAPRHQDQ